jgi:phage terminase small subunit
MRARVALSNKQRVFIEEYLRCWNATEAARLAGYSEKTARFIGAENLTKPYIAEEIRLRLAEKQMSTDEALALLADQARGDLGDFMDVSRMGFSLNLLDESGQRKNTRIIRKIKQKTTTFLGKKEDDEDREIHEVEIELYDAQAAIDKILRVHGKYKETIDLNVRSYDVSIADDA